MLNQLVTIQIPSPLHISGILFKITNFINGRNDKTSHSCFKFLVRYYRMKKLLLTIGLIFSAATLPAQNFMSLPVEASIYYQNGEYEKALDIYERLFQKDKNSFYQPYFNTLLKLKKYEEAERVIRDRIKTAENSLLYDIAYGQLLQERGEQAKAQDKFKQVIARLPADEFIIRETANAFYQAEAYDYAIKTFQAGRSLLKNDRIFSFDLISLYRYQRNKEMLILEYLNILSQDQEALSRAQNIISSVLEGPQDYEILKKILLARLQKEPQQVVYSELLAWTFLQQKEFSLALKQYIALDKRLNESGSILFELVSMLLANKAYPEAVEALDYLVRKGSSSMFYIPARIGLLAVKNKQLENSNDKTKLAALEKEYETLLGEFGQNIQTVAAMRQLARLQAYQLEKPDYAVGLLENAVQIKGLPASEVGQLKLELGDLYVLIGELWEASLVYQQAARQFAGQPEGNEANFRNAKLSYFMGDFTWAKAQLDVLKSSTSQLIANDALNLSLLIAENTASESDSNALKYYAAAGLYEFKAQPQAALSMLDSISTKFPGNSLADDILMAKARIYIKQHNYTQAAAFLETIVSQYSWGLWADDALFMLGDVFETELKKPEKAKEYFQKLIIEHSSSLYVDEARNRFRNLRGDQPQ